jgi:hypothetical protein
MRLIENQEIKLLRSNHSADPCCFVVFGASGDLTHRLLIPALYEVPSEAFRKQLGATLRRFVGPNSHKGVGWRSIPPGGVTGPTKPDRPRP